MNREINLRAWDNIRKKIINPEEMEDNEIYHIGISYGKPFCARVYGDLTELELMQYTGLKDKNGIEIYEGDLVKWITGDSGEEEIGLIKWDSGYAGFGISGGHCLDFNHCIEVVGNIYENPELING